MSGDKSQPQRLLEEVDSTIQHTESEQYPTDPPKIVDAPKFPTIQEQNAYWQEKEKAAEPLRAGSPTGQEAKPTRKWSLARRRKFNAKRAGFEEEKRVVKSSSSWHEVPPPPQEAVPQVKHCPFCGGDIQRFLA